MCLDQCQELDPFVGRRPPRARAALR
jgi:hypothetical protein